MAVPQFPDRTTLTAKDRVVLRAVAEAMFGQDGEVDAARLDAHITEVDAFISAASRPVRSGLRIALFVVRIAPLLYFFSLRPIERLSVDDRVEILSRLEASRLAHLSLAFIGWRTVMTLLFYEHPSELAQLGYAGEERYVYKRRLALAPRLVIAPLIDPLIAPPMPPPALESGVRLREGADADAANEAANDSGEHKVA